jgi:hypothetical protein
MSMGRHLLRAVAIVAAFAMIFTASALAKREVVRVGNLFLADNGGISPSKLPRHEAPISAHIHGEIGTTDGSHPPAVETITLDVDKTIEVNAKGLPVCTEGRLEARPTAAAKRACSASIVGSGAGEVEVAFPEQKPIIARGPIFLFNGGVHGGTTVLYIHTYVAIPAPTAVVVTVKVSRINRGHFGLRTVADIPRIAGGAGSATEFELTIDRKFTHKGKKQSLLTASCPTGSYYTEGEVRFSDGTELGLRHVLPCTPMG